MKKYYVSSRRWPPLKEAIINHIPRWLYTVCYTLLTPGFLGRLWWKGRKLPAYRARIAERFGSIRQKTAPVDIWLHAVSLGEVNAAAPLITQLLEDHKTLLITTMTPTGSQRVRDLFQDRVVHQYIPYELPSALKKFFKHYQPKIGIIFETELWPNLLYYAHRAQVKLLLFNARLSESSMRGYLKIAPLVKKTLQLFTGIYAQSKADAERFKTLGALPHCVHVAGNIKFDVAAPKEQPAQYSQLRACWGPQRLVIMAASTHEGEESQILKSFQLFQSQLPHALLCIAPRHPERFQAVFELAGQLGFSTGLRSQIHTMDKHYDVFIVDSLGELSAFYAISDYAFVGGSLVNIGGHNVLEPIAVQIPVLTGPHVKNFQNICQGLLQEQAIIQVENADDLFQHILFLEQHVSVQQAMVKRAFDSLQRNRGVLSTYLNVLY